MSNSQSTMCAGLSIKLKIKSNRGKLRKRMPSLRNPFDIAKVRGSSVQEALEILASAKNMGLSINRDRATIVKEIAKRLERKEL
ncbi:hypothetical protein ACET3Z_021218 [Daucus carota]